MKKTVIPLIIAVAAMTLVTGCAWQVGGDKHSELVQPTTGQQLIDLKRARDTGAISEPDYEAQKAKLLGNH